MVDELRLWMINVDAFRQCFAAPPELAARLTSIAESLGPARRTARGLLAKLGPLTRRPAEAPVVRPGVPNLHDAEAMLTSRFVATDRLGASWVLARAWLDALADAHTAIPLPASEIDALEFDLVRAGVPTSVSIRHLWGRSVDLPLRATGDMSFGYMPGGVVPRLVDEWMAALPDLDEGTAAFATTLLAFAQPSAAGPDETRPDLIAWWTAR
ncbi:MAG: hypothetical protein LBI33_14100 [Propionibacteriaceae bacterium]|jgi:hypothetical protein|nr:hypothetical protein [Propionibacteriaceae bacterium]